VETRRRDQLGAFEHAVLAAIVHLDEDAYGVTIRREIERRTSRDVAIGALYTALDRLERKDYVSSHASDPTPQRGGRSKRHYAVTAGGRRAMRESRAFLIRMWAGLPAAVRRAR
jgi:DNA-binding PadR family transcriptional regulator